MKDISKDKKLLKFHLESISAGGEDLIESGTYEMVGENEQSWDVSIPGLCQTAFDRIQYLEQQLERYSMSAGQADQRMAESKAVRKALGFGEYSDHVSPRDLVDAIKKEIGS